MPRWTPDDVRLVSAALTTPLCVACIVGRTGVTRVRVEAILAMLDGTRKVPRGLAMCSACGETRELFWLRGSAP